MITTSRKLSMLFLFKGKIIPYFIHVEILIGTKKLDGNACCSTKKLRLFRNKLFPTIYLCSSKVTKWQVCWDVRKVWDPVN